MDSVDEIMQLCRLCLVKDEVNIPIFEEQGDLRQIFLKISACLPVKVSKEDNLPKNICDGCSCKLETLYQFWNTSANSEKKLIKWLSQVDKPVSDKHSMNIDPVILKQEVVEVPDDRHSPDDDLVPDDLNVSNDAEDYLIQQQQLPYQNVEFQFQQEEFDQTGTDANVVETGPPSRKRRAAAIRAMANMGSEDEDNPDLLEPKIAKTEEESEESCNEDPEPTTFVGLPSATDNEQPGPSGVGKPAADAPYTIWQLYRVVKLSKPQAPQIFSCTTCQKSFKNKKTLRTHVNYVHNRVACHPCKICGRPFKHKTDAKYHEDVHNSTKGHKCEICGKSYFSKYYLKIHISRDHADNRKFECKKCDKRYYYERELELHNNKAHLGVNFKCPDCDKTYIDLHYLNAHRRTHEPDYIPKVYTCGHCRTKYTSMAGYTKHLKTHSSKDQCLVCDTCGKRISSMASFQNHLRIHSGEKPFKCTTCDKAFSSKSILVTHLRVHTKEKPYKCEHCSKSFTQRGTLTIHLRQHTGERPYTCHICSKCFASKMILRSHIKAHLKSVDKGAPF